MIKVYFLDKKPSLVRRLICGLTGFVFLFTSVFPPNIAAQTILNLPIPGAVVPVTSGFTPAMIKGVNLYPDNPLKFDFIIDKGELDFTDDEFEQESTKLIKYFLSSLTVPEDEMWVNLSPYEKDRIVPQDFGQTEMGRDLLAQDYMLKQLTASLMNPDDELGGEFWQRVYSKAQEKYGTTDIPMNTFNKVWIVPEKAVVYEHEKGAFVVKSHLKVLMEEDYIALHQNGLQSTVYGPQQDSPAAGSRLSAVNIPSEKVVSGLQSQIVKDLLIPEIEREVNEGKTFANLRQIYNAVILASWYKGALKESLLGQVYVDQKKTKGVETNDKEINEKIYNQYVESFKKGVYNYIKEEYDPEAQEVINKKYFSGGAIVDPRDKLEIEGSFADSAMASVVSPHRVSVDLASLGSTVKGLLSRVVIRSFKTKLLAEIKELSSDLDIDGTIYRDIQSALGLLDESGDLGELDSREMVESYFTSIVVELDDSQIKLENFRELLGKGVDALSGVIRKRLEEQRERNRRYEFMDQISIKMEKQSEDLVRTITEKIEQDEPVKVCFICTGNVNRSAVAHVLATDAVKKLGKANVQIVSGGLTNAYEGRELEEQYKVRLREQGIDDQAINDFRTEVAKSEDLADADLIVIADPSNIDGLNRKFGEEIPDLFDRAVFFTHTRPELSKRYGNKMPDPAYDRISEEELVELMQSTVIPGLFGKVEGKLADAAMLTRRSFLTKSGLTVAVAAFGGGARAYAAARDILSSLDSPDSLESIEAPEPINPITGYTESEMNEDPFAGQIFTSETEIIAHRNKVNDELNADRNNALEGKKLVSVFDLPEIEGMKEDHDLRRELAGYAEESGLHIVGNFDITKPTMVFAHGIHPSWFMVPTGDMFSIPADAGSPADFRYFIEHFKNRYNMVVFSYNPKQDINNPADLFNKELKKLKQTYPVHGLTVIGHSYGSILINKAIWEDTGELYKHAYVFRMAYTGGLRLLTGMEERLTSYFPNNVRSLSSDPLSQDQIAINSADGLDIMNEKTEALFTLNGEDDNAGPSDSSPQIHKDNFARIQAKDYIELKGASTNPHAEPIYSRGFIHRVDLVLKSRKAINDYSELFQDDSHFDSTDRRVADAAMFAVSRLRQIYDRLTAQRDAMEMAQIEPVVPTNPSTENKYDETGNEKPFHGKTVGFWFNQEQNEVLKSYQDEIKRGLVEKGIDKKFSFIDPNTFHVTLHDLLTTVEFTVRKKARNKERKWPKVLNDLTDRVTLRPADPLPQEAQDYLDEALDRAFARILTEIREAPRVLIGPITAMPGESISLAAIPTTVKQMDIINSIREIIKEETGINLEETEEGETLYSFFGYITLVNQISDLDEEDYEKLMEVLGGVYEARLGEVVLNKIESRSFDMVSHFNDVTHSVNLGDAAMLAADSAMVRSQSELTISQFEPLEINLKSLLILSQAAFEFGSDAAMITEVSDEVLSHHGIPDRKYIPINTVDPQYGDEIIKFLYLDGSTLTIYPSRGQIYQLRADEKLKLIALDTLEGASREIWEWIKKIMDGYLKILYQDDEVKRRLILETWALTESKFENISKYGFNNFLELPTILDPASYRGSLEGFWRRSVGIVPAIDTGELAQLKGIRIPVPFKINGVSVQALFITSTGKLISGNGLVDTPDQLKAPLDQIMARAEQADSTVKPIWDEVLSAWGYSRDAAMVAYNAQTLALDKRTPLQIFFEQPQFKSKYQSLIQFLERNQNLEEVITKSIAEFINLHHFYYDLDEFIDKLSTFDMSRSEIQEVILDIIQFSKNVDTDTSEGVDARHLMWKLGETFSKINDKFTVKLNKDFPLNHLMLSDQDLDDLPMLDLASGTRAITYLKSLKNKKVIIADHSYFVEAYLNQIKILFGLGDNVVIRRVDIRDHDQLLQEEKYRHVRMANVDLYVDGLEQPFYQAIFDKIAPGGSFSVETPPGTTKDHAIENVRSIVNGNPLWTRLHGTIVSLGDEKINYYNFIRDGLHPLASLISLRSQQGPVRLRVEWFGDKLSPQLSLTWREDGERKSEVVSKEHPLYLTIFEQMVPFESRPPTGTVSVLELSLNSNTDSVYTQIQRFINELNMRSLSQLITAKVNTTQELMALNDRNLSAYELNDIKREVIELSEQLYLEGQQSNEGGMFPLAEDEWDAILTDDKQTGYSQIYRDADGHVIGFLLARWNQERQTIYIEKIGVKKEARQKGIAVEMLNAFAQKAVENAQSQFIDLLVLKQNTTAIETYENLGFENWKKEAADADPEANAYLFYIWTGRLLRSTGQRLKNKTFTEPIPDGDVELTMNWQLPGTLPSATLRWQEKGIRKTRHLSTAQKKLLTAILPNNRWPEAGSTVHIHFEANEREDEVEVMRRIKDSILDIAKVVSVGDAAMAAEYPENDPRNPAFMDNLQSDLRAKGSVRTAKELAEQRAFVSKARADAQRLEIDVDDLMALRTSITNINNFRPVRDEYPYPFVVREKLKGLIDQIIDNKVKEFIARDEKLKESKDVKEEIVDRLINEHLRPSIDKLDTKDVWAPEEKEEYMALARTILLEVGGYIPISPSFIKEKIERFLRLRYKFVHFQRFEVIEQLINFEKDIGLSEYDPDRNNKAQSFESNHKSAIDLLVSVKVFLFVNEFAQLLDQEDIPEPVKGELLRYAKGRLILNTTENSHFNSFITHWILMKDNAVVRELFDDNDFEKAERFLIDDYLEKIVNQIAILNTSGTFYQKDTFNHELNRLYELARIHPELTPLLIIFDFVFTKGLKENVPYRNYDGPPILPATRLFKFIKSLNMEQLKLLETLDIPGLMKTIKGIKSNPNNPVVAKTIENPNRRKFINLLSFDQLDPSISTPKLGNILSLEQKADFLIDRYKNGMRPGDMFWGAIPGNKSDIHDVKEYIDGLAEVFNKEGIDINEVINGPKEVPNPNHNKVLLEGIVELVLFFLDVKDYEHLVLSVIENIDVFEHMSAILGQRNPALKPYTEYVNKIIKSLGFRYHTLSLILDPQYNGAIIKGKGDVFKFVKGIYQKAENKEEALSDILELLGEDHEVYHLFNYLYFPSGHTFDSRAVAKRILESQDQINPQAVKAALLEILTERLAHRGSIYVDRREMNAEQFLEYMLTHKKFQIPGYVDNFLQMADAVHQQKTSFTGQYLVDSLQKERWKYSNAEKMTTDEMWNQEEGLSGHVAVHQIHHANDGSWTLERAILMAGYLIPREVLNNVNMDNKLADALRAGKINPLGSSSYMHFGINDAIFYLDEPIGVVYPVEVLLENQAYLQGPLSTTDWHVKGFSKNLDNESHKIPVEAGTILVPKSKQTEFEQIMGVLEQTYPGWQRPVNIFYYDGNYVRDGVQQLKEQYGLTEPTKPAISKKPEVIGEFPDSRLRGQYVNLFAVKPDQNGVIKYQDLPHLTRFNQPLQQDQEELTSVQTLSGHLETIATQAVTDMGIPLKRPAQDTGSSYRGTYQERFRGLPDDFDLMVYAEGDLPSQATLQEFQRQFAQNDQLREELTRALGDDVDFRIEPVANINYRPESGYAQTSLKVFTGTEENVPLLTVDVVFYNNEKNNDGPRYQQKWDSNMDLILSQLPMEQREEGRQQILSTVRTLKALFKNEGVYKRWEGGLRGVGTEQLVMQLNGATDQIGTPNPVASLDELKSTFSVQSAMAKLMQVGFDEQGKYVQVSDGASRLSLWDPGAEEPINLASGLLQAGYRLLLGLAIDYEELYSPESLAGITGELSEGTVAADQPGDKAMFGTESVRYVLESQSREIVGEADAAMSAQDLERLDMRFNNAVLATKSPNLVEARAVIAELESQEDELDKRGKRFLQIFKVRLGDITDPASVIEEKRSLSDEVVGEILVFSEEALEEDSSFYPKRITISRLVGMLSDIQSVDGLLKVALDSKNFKAITSSVNSLLYKKATGQIEKLRQDRNFLNKLVDLVKQYGHSREEEAYDRIRVLIELLKKLGALESLKNLLSEGMNGYVMGLVILSFYNMKNGGEAINDELRKTMPVWIMDALKEEASLLEYLPASKAAIAALNILNAGDDVKRLQEDGIFIEKLTSALEDEAKYSTALWIIEQVEAFEILEKLDREREFRSVLPDKKIGEEVILVNVEVNVDQHERLVKKAEDDILGQNTQVKILPTIRGKDYVDQLTKIVEANSEASIIVNVPWGTVDIENKSITPEKVNGLLGINFVEEMGKQGVLFVVSAGNNFEKKENVQIRQAKHPKLDNLIVTAAALRDEEGAFIKAPYSFYGFDVNFTSWGIVRYLLWVTQGTSLSSSYVAATVAHVAKHKSQEDPSLTMKDILAMVREKAKQMPASPAFQKGMLGHGFIDPQEVFEKLGVPAGGDMAMLIEEQSKRVKTNGLPDYMLKDAEIIDAAMSTKGGIDLNPTMINTEIKRNGRGVIIPTFKEPMPSFEGVEGFVPTIINVTPINNLPLLLGVVDDQDKPIDVSFNLSALPANKQD